MKVLFDHNIPKKLRQYLPGHFVQTARELGWDMLKNGDLLDAAETSGFEVIITGDKNLSHQQNLGRRNLSVIVLETTDWNVLKKDPSPVVFALHHAVSGGFQGVTFTVTDAQ